MSCARLVSTAIFYTTIGGLSKKGLFGWSSQNLLLSVLTDIFSCNFLSGNIGRICIFFLSLSKKEFCLAFLDLTCTFPEDCFGETVQKTLLTFCSETEWEIFRLFNKKSWARLSKLNSACPDEDFWRRTGKSCFFFWNMITRFSNWEQKVIGRVVKAVLYVSRETCSGDNL